MTHSKITNTEIIEKWELTEEDLCKALAFWLDDQSNNGPFEITPNDLDWDISQGSLLKGVTYTRVTVESNKEPQS